MNDELFEVAQDMSGEIGRDFKKGRRRSNRLKRFEFPLCEEFVVPPRAIAFKFAIFSTNTPYSNRL